MGERKSAAIIIAMFAAVLVMLAGKSCAENMKQERQKNASVNNTAASTPSQATYADVTRSNSVTVPVEPTQPQVEYVTDILGRVIGTVENNSNSGSVTVSEIEYVTDILGRVIGTVENKTEVTQSATVPATEYVTDILGRVVKVIENTTEPVQTTTVKKENKNPLQEYQEQHSTAPVTRDHDIDEQGYTAPSTLQISIG